MDNEAVQLLIDELEKFSTLHKRRLEIGNLLDEMGDIREGVGSKNECPDFKWITQQFLDERMPHPLGEGEFIIGENAQIRLPTEGEWQWAAQNGSEKRPFPWGSKEMGYANTVESGLERVTAVGLYPHGAAACGALDMGGNVMEWCLSDKLEVESVDLSNDSSKVIRGGDWGYQLENASCFYCDDEAPSRQDPLNGFRLIIGKILI